MAELNIDGLVGPTHNYAGLSFGNLASKDNHGQASNPKAAALQGLDKMRRLIDLGVPQAVMPPHERPFLPRLRRLGFNGTDRAIIQSAMRDHPSLYANHCSASSMWTANAATVSPSADCQDGKLHFTPANLSAMPHRSLEGATTARLLKLMFNDKKYFHVHDLLPAHPNFGDEGAANHNRLSSNTNKKGLEIFVYGRRGFNAQGEQTHFPARQTFEASQSIIRRHQLRDEQTVLAKQNPIAIDAGAFHNDVVCVTNGNVIMHHQDAFSNHEALVKEITEKAQKLDIRPIFLTASRDEMSLSHAVKSYVFNSQIIMLSNGDMALILPKEAQENKASYNFIQRCLDGDNPITDAYFLDLKQSMSNGGGPACLRLRVQMTDQEIEAMHQAVIMTHEKIDRLETWVNQHYRDRLVFTDLADPKFLDETQTALDDLTKILEMGSFYHFQNDGVTQWSTHE